ncbi:SH3 domain-binding glutamic acid-rich protein homolog [Tribolium madens]|uniref:SH3 domain-binding glutamic acid-rich protein homolog n=1 Tax=Tribolium madens TaxID=41895 RepID=UPI001CF74D81|nr:SH3 domain-binding glutamic acid-rich protein homolog [Tribolium madens]
MVVKVYISGISGNKEVKKRQQRVLLILDSKNINYEVIDIAEPENEEKKDFMQNNSTSSGATISDPNPRHPLPPQIFNDDVYCGDYDQFDMANEIDEMEKFLKLAPSDSEPSVTSNAELKLGNGEIHNAPQESNETKETEESKDETVPDNNESGDAKVENGEETEEKHVEENEEEADE